MRGKHLPCLYRHTLSEIQATITTILMNPIMPPMMNLFILFFDCSTAVGMEDDVANVVPEEVAGIMVESSKSKKKTATVI